MSKYKIFCDESNHLLDDPSNIMVNGALQIEEDKVKEANLFIKKLRYEYNYQTEIKWTKLVKKQLPFYKKIYEYSIRSNIRRKINKNDPSAYLLKEEVTLGCLSVDGNLCG